MSITYAGVDLPLPTRRARRAIARDLSLRKTRLFNMRMASTERIAQSNVGQLQRYNIFDLDRQGGTDNLSIMASDGDGDHFFSQGWGDQGWGGWGFAQGSTTSKAPYTPAANFTVAAFTATSLVEALALGLGGASIPGQPPLTTSADARTLRWTLGGNQFNTAAWESDGFFDPELPVDVGTLYWPTGASRWAVGYFLATDSQLATIRKQCYQPAVPKTKPLMPVPQTLEIVGVGGVDGKIRTKLYLLPAWPLLGVPGFDNLNLLTLVDERYFWRSRRIMLGAEGHKAGESDWSFTLRRFATTVVGAAMQADKTIPQGRHYTDQGAFDQYPSPWEMDFWCHNMGARFTRGLDGVCRVYGFEMSESILTQNFARKLARVATAGGQLMLGTEAAVKNADVKPSDNPALLPSRHVVWRPALETDSSFPILDGLVCNTPALKGFETCFGNGLTRHCFDFGAIGQAQCNQIALDWCRYAASPLDLKFAGIVNYMPEGISDHIEWIAREEEHSTRISRPAFENAPTGFYWHEDMAPY